MYPWLLDMSTARLHAFMGHDKLVGETAQFQSPLIEKFTLKEVLRKMIQKTRQTEIQFYKIKVVKHCSK